MAIQYIPITPKEFIAKVLGGERDFTRARLTDGNLNADPVKYKAIDKCLQPATRGSSESLILNDADFSGVYAKGLYLNQLQAKSACFKGADLSEANLLAATLTESDFSGANLSKSKIYTAHAREARFIGTNLKGAELHVTDFTGSNFDSAQLEGAILHHAIMEGASFKGANLKRIDGSNLDLTGADLEGADLYFADLRRAQLHEVKNLDKASLKGVSLFDTHVVAGSDVERILLEYLKNFALSPSTPETNGGA